MSAPSTDSAAIRQAIRTLKVAGFTLRSANNGEDGWVKISKEQDAIDEVMACDSGTLSFNGPDGKRVGSLFFVFGNMPYEVIADYSWVENENGEAFTKAIDILTDKWQDD